MEVVCANIKKIKCINDDCSVLELNCIDSFNESDYEILVESASYNTGLKRGWNGDLVYEAARCCEFPTGHQVDDIVISGNYKDVILKSIRPIQYRGEQVMWEYCFIKK